MSGYYKMIELVFLDNEIRFFKKALDMKATDIHFSPQEKGYQIRMRVMDVLKLFEDKEKIDSENLIMTVRRFCNFDVNAKGIPQRGRFKTIIDKREVSLLASIVPTYFGDKLVLRFYNASLDKINFKNLRVQNEKKLKNWINRPFGLIVCGGMTGSGKTTMCYAFLNEIKNKEISIVSVEDPIEVLIENVDQIPLKANSELTYESLIQSVLGSDPDVLFIGEVSNEEVLKKIILSAQTGHLVLTQLHTKNNIQTARLFVDMGVDKFFLKSFFTGFLNQRFVRCLCPHCKSDDSLDESTANEYGLPIDLKMKKPIGCSHCFHTGYKGRQVVQEYYEPSSLFWDKVYQGASDAELREIISDDGGTSYHDEGIGLLKDEVLSLEEFIRCLSE